MLYVGCRRLYWGAPLQFWREWVELRGHLRNLRNCRGNSVSFLRKLFEVEEKYTGIYINNISQQFIEELDSINLLKDYRIELWKDKYQNLLFWLTIFTNPLYLILSFILFLAIIYHYNYQLIKVYYQCFEKYHLYLYWLNQLLIHCLHI